MIDIFIYTSLIFYLSLALLRPRLALFLILALLPSFLLRSELFGIPTTWLELAIYIFAFASIVNIVVKKKLHLCKQIWQKYQLPLLVLLLWITTALFAVITSTNLTLSAGAWKGWWFDPILLTFILLLHTKTWLHVKQVFLALLSGAALVSFFGLTEWVLGIGMQADGLLNSFFKPANYVAMYTVPITLAGFGLLLAYRLHFKYKIAIATLIAVNFIALLLTQSYGGFLGLGAGIITLAAFQPQPKLRKKYLLAILVIGLISAAVIATQPKFQRLFDLEKRSSITTRLQIWEISTEVLKKNWLNGVGLGNFEQPYRKQAYAMYQPPLEWEVVKAHNLYLNTWLEMGLSGLFVLLMMVVLFVRRVTQNLKILPIDSEQWWVHATVVAAFISILTHGLLDTPYFKNDLAIIFLCIWIAPWLINQTINKE